MDLHNFQKQTKKKQLGRNATDAVYVRFVKVERGGKKYFFQFKAQRQANRSPPKSIYLG